MTPEASLARAFGTLSELLALHARDAPRHAAIVHGERRLDYGELDRFANRVAAALQRGGLGRGHAIAICAVSSIEYLGVFVGGLRAGLAVAPIAPSLAPDSIAGMVHDCGAKVLFLDAPAGDAIEAVARSIGANRVALDGSAVGEPLDAWMASPGMTAAFVEVEPHDPFNIIYSSGTTGAPKGIVQPHAMRWAHMQRGPAYDYSPGSISLISTPLYSNTTLVAVFPTLATGGTLVLMPKFDARAYLELAASHRVTHTMLVPVQYQRIMALADFERFDLSSFRMKFSTSAPFAAALKADVLERWPGGLIEYYGMTEGGGTAILLAHQHRDKLHTVGRPAPGHDIRVIDEDGRELPQGESGEFVGRSGAMMTGYHKRPDSTADAEWFDAAGERFIRTGDIGRFDNDGFMVLLDRKKDVIISGGFNIYPSDLEAVLARHPGVADVAVVAQPSAQWGETPFAFVVARNGAALDGGELMQWANRQLGRAQRLAGLRLLDALPRNATGKILKRELRDAL